MQKAKLYTLHRLLSTTVLVLSFIWILSGFMHPIMSWTKPAAKNFRPPNTAFNVKTPFDLTKIIKDNDLKNIQQIRRVSFQDTEAYQIISAEVRYFNVASGLEIPDGDKVYAVYLAQHYSGRTEDMETVTDINRFDFRYPFVNRLLPVKKVHLKQSGEDYYVHTRSSRLGTVGSPLKDSFSWFFMNFHNLNILNSLPWLKFTAMLLSMLAIAFTAFTGLWLFFKTYKQQKKGLRKYHVWVGLVAAQVIFIMTFSGLFHITVKTVTMNEVKPLENKPFLNPSSWGNSLQSLSSNINSGFSIVTVNGKDYVRSSTFDKDKGLKISYTSLSDSSFKSDKEIAFELAAVFAGKSVEDIEKSMFTPKFTSEYGFINKRLPVWKIDFKGSADSYYIETSSQKLSTLVTPLKRAEGFSFAYLHKAHFLDFLGKDLRDCVLMFFCVLIGFTAISGNIIKKRK